MVQYRQPVIVLTDRDVTSMLMILALLTSEERSRFNTPTARKIFAQADTLNEIPDEQGFILRVVQG